MGDVGRTRSAEERLQRVLKMQELLARVSREIGPALHVGPVLHTVLGALRSLADFHGGSVWLVEGHHVALAAADPPLPEGHPDRIPVGSGLLGAVVQRREVVDIADVAATGPADPGIRPGARSWLGVPLVVLGDVTGLVQVDSERPDAFDDEDRTMLEGLAVQVAGAIESAKRFEEIMGLERLKSDFIARVSHELRTPITIVAGFVSTLQAHGEELGPDERGRMLDRIDGATARLSGLIDELLMLTRLEAGIVAAQPERTDLAGVLEEVRRESSAPGDVTVTCDPGLEVVTDPGLLKRALGFLVDNGLKYAGAVAVAASPGVVDIVDHGPGIDPELRKTAFERFTRGADVTSVPGMGIGLPMARSLLAWVGADLVLVPPGPNGGTHLRIDLPTP